MVCPFCNIDMEKGVLIRGRFRLRWLKEKATLTRSILIKLYEFNNLEGYRCSNCNKLILDVNMERNDLT